MDYTGIGGCAENAEETEQTQVFVEFLMDALKKKFTRGKKVDQDRFDTIEGNSAVCLYDAQKTVDKKGNLVDS